MSRKTFYTLLKEVDYKARKKPGSEETILGQKSAIIDVFYKNGGVGTTLEKEFILEQLAEYPSYQGAVQTPSKVFAFYRQQLVPEILGEEIEKPEVTKAAKPKKAKAAVDGEDAPVKGKKAKGAKSMTRFNASELAVEAETLGPDEDDELELVGDDTEVDEDELTEDDIADEEIEEGFEQDDSEDQEPPAYDPNAPAIV